MTNEKILAIVPSSIQDVDNLASKFSKSSLIPESMRGKEADVFVAIMAGQELGLPPMASLRSIHVVKGRPILSADVMVGLVLGSGVADYFSCVDESATSVTYETRRRGSPHAQRNTWTLDDAKRAGLDGDNWRKYPRAMLKARCRAALARDVYPDVLAGCYDEDEARELSIERPSVIEVRPLPDVAKPAQLPPAPAQSPQSTTGLTEDQVTELLDVIGQCADDKELKGIAGRIAKSNPTKDQRERLLAAYGERGAQLRAAVQQEIPT